MLEKTHDFAHREMLEETLRPVVSSTAASTEAITNQLVPIKEGITALNANFKLRLHRLLQNRDQFLILVFLSSIFHIS